MAIDQDGNQEISPLELRTYPLSRNIRVRLNESTESALMNDSGKHRCVTLVCVQDLIGSPFLGLRFSTSTVKYLMSVFVCLYFLKGRRRYVICKQDYDNSRGISFQEVCVTNFRVIRILKRYNTVRAPVELHYRKSFHQDTTLSRLTLEVAMATNVRIIRH